ncbi:MAG: Major facilitator superfamily MFS_1 transporter [Clostridiales bacterium 38_11]|nr:MAG: Major facilitator superfamily MFS_1 transporter [Clostridiales bacterium 38_11]HBH12687.1 MFS transporter [Clostridiales bacterium]
MWNVVFLGLVSFFADISAEMVYPIIPLYLTSVFGATPALIGIIEGIAESIASLLKVFSGYITDKYNNKKPIAFLGYATGLIYKIALIVASSWGGILGARIIDRIGKGIRTAPRDVMVSESVDRNRMGTAFGIHKALDMAGSAIGILIAYLLLSSENGAFDYKNLFLISIIPALLSLAIIPFIKEKKENRTIKEREPFWKNVKKLDAQLKLYLLVAFLFTLGNSSNAFLLLRAKSVGFNDTSVILLYFIYNITASLLAIPLGKRSDQVGRKRLLVAGYLVFAIVYIGFAFAYNKTFMIALFVLYGVYTAMIAGVERAFIAEISPQELKGTMLGLHSTIVGIALLPASTIAGVLWTSFGAETPFVFGAFLSLAAAFVLIILMKGGRPAREEC